MTKRHIPSEKTKVNIGNTPAVSSHQALMYHLITPDTIKRLAERMTVGALKYGSVQWKQGIEDIDFVSDRINHLFEHILNFMENGNSNDDNLGAILWCVNFLITVEKQSPETLSKVLDIHKLYGKEATEFHKDELIRRNK